MQVAQDTVVSLHYELLDSQGELIEKTDAPIEYLHGGYDGIFALVEQALQGKSVGETCDVYLQP
ncbi:MAG: peptidylprolyl isomerase, partial [Betaproteobacteria bacterium]|nr:peptidylprolyl isomerase [Betaproteobacteria bacterium]